MKEVALRCGSVFLLPSFSPMFSLSRETWISQSLMVEDGKALAAMGDLYGPNGQVFNSTAS